MYEIFEQLLLKYGVTTYKVSKATKIAQSVFSSWKNGISTPKSDKMQKIADYFGVSVVYLMTGKDEFEKKENSLSSIEERDIKKHIDIIMESLEGKDKIVFDGAEVTLTDHNKKMLRRALEMAYDVVANEKEKEQK